MSSILKKMYDSPVVQILLTLITYSLYAIVLGLSMGPSFAFLAWAWNALIAPGATFWSWMLFSLCAGAAVYIFFIVGILVMGTSVRLLCSGIKPGIYPEISLVMLRWLIYSGIYSIARTLILYIVRGTFFSTLFFRIMGCKIGKNVFLNSVILNDAQFIELGDNVTIGGGAQLTCHLYEKGRLILDPIKIGEGSLIGADSYIAPGVTVGKKCVIGLHSVIRRGKTIPDGMHYTGLAALPVREMAKIEKVNRKRE
jgi:acetyltransferase-like isoleucine patch superfamily enzyme